MANIISRSINPGLQRWHRLDAQITQLLHPKTTLPVITFGSPHHPRILITSGLHLEETSGPLTLLNPQLFPPTLLHRFHFTIIPVVNQRGLRFSSTAPEKYLRRTTRNHNYNDLWFHHHYPQPPEVTQVQQFILQSHRHQPFQLSISLHEDSDVPHQAYVWTNGLTHHQITHFHSAIPTRLLSTFYHIPPRYNPYGGSIKHKFFIVDAPDLGSIENWLSDILHIPTLLFEGPFGPKLQIRTDFQATMISTALSALFK